MNDLPIQRYLHILRDKNTDTATFRWASDNLAKLLCAEALAKLPHEEVEVETPVGTAKGPRLTAELMVVPIYRAGQSLVQPFLDTAPGTPVGALLIQRDEATAEPKLYYRKLADPLPEYAVIVDPMLATAGSATLAAKVLQEAGYPVEKIHFLGVIASREGYSRLAEVLPEENITVAAIDPELNDRKYIVPGLGDYGDRYFGA